MRYTWIDGMCISVGYCAECPFFATERVASGFCKYPYHSANSGRSIGCWGSVDMNVQEDCPLKMVK